MTDRVPTAPEAEEQLIGAALMLPEIVPDLRKLVDERHFTTATHRIAWREIGRLAVAGDPIESTSVLAALKGRPEFPDGAACYLIEVGQSVTTAANAQYYAKRVKDAAVRRQIISASEAAIDGAKNGHTAEQVINSLMCDVEDLRRVAVGDKPAFPIYTAAELSATDYPLTYIVERLLVEGQFCIMGGPKKALKTTLAVVLAICIALGIPFLGQFAIPRRRRVLVCSCESGMATIKDIANRACKSFGTKLAQVDGLAFSPAVPKPHDAKSWAEFCRVVQEYQPDVLFLDALYRMLTGDGAENLFKMAVPLDTIDTFCKSNNITPIVCHHLKTGRLNQFAPADMDDLAYAGAAEFMRQGIMLTRREAYEAGTGMHRLWLHVGGSAGHNSLWALDAFEGTCDAPGGRCWETTITKADDARDAAKERADHAKATAAEQQLLADRTAACKVLAKHPNGLSKSMLGDLSGCGRRWPKVFAAMLNKGDIVPIDITVSNHRKPITGYTLAN